MRFEQFRMATQLIQRGFWRVAAFMVFSMAAVGAWAQGAGTVNFSASSYRVSENDGSLTVSVSRVRGSSGNISVDYVIAPGTATAGRDYDGTNGTLVWTDGDTAPKTFDIVIQNDFFLEEEETILLSLTNPQGGAAVGALGQCRVEIEGDESGALGFTKTAYITSESDLTVEIMVSRGLGATGAILVDYEVRGGANLTAEQIGGVTHSRRLPDGDDYPDAIQSKFVPGVQAVAGQDFIAAEGTLEFRDFEMSKTFEVALMPNLDGQAYPFTMAELVLSNARAAEGEPESVQPVINPEFATATLRINDVLGGPEIDLIWEQEIWPDSTEAGHDRRGFRFGQARYRFSEFLGVEDQGEKDQGEGKIEIPVYRSSPLDKEVEVGYMVGPNRGFLVDDARENWVNEAPKATPWTGNPGDDFNTTTKYLYLPGDEPRITPEALTGTLFAFGDTAQGMHDRLGLPQILISSGSDIATPTGDRVLTPSFNLPLMDEWVKRDFHVVTGTLQWAADDTDPKNIEIQLINDDLAEFNEDLIVVLYLKDYEMENQGRDEEVDLNTDNGGGGGGGGDPDDPDEPEPDQPEEKWLKPGSSLGVQFWTIVTIENDDQPAGAVEADFVPAMNNDVYDIAMVPESADTAEFLKQDKMYVVGDFTAVGAQPRNRIARVTQSGALDETFDPGLGANGFVNSIALSYFNIESGESEEFLLDARPIIGGGFTAFNGLARGGVARLNSDGSVDKSFEPGPIEGDVLDVLSQLDNKVIVVGDFFAVDGEVKNSVVRFNVDGSIDEAFDVGKGPDGPVYATTLMPDGRVVIVGDFLFVNGHFSPSIAILDAETGSVDKTFNPGDGIEGEVYDVDVYYDGKIIVGGNFDMVNGTPRRNIARLLPNGQVDFSFNPGTGVDGPVNSVFIDDSVNVVGAPTFDLTGQDELFQNMLEEILERDDPDEDEPFLSSLADAGGIIPPYFRPTLQEQLPPMYRVLIGGAFSELNGTRRMGVARLNPDGTVDTSFMDTAYNQLAGLPKKLSSDAGGIVNVIRLNQADGGIVIGGVFDEVGGGGLGRADVSERANLAKLKGGETWGPGALEFSEDSYSSAESDSLASISMKRKNGSLGMAAVRFKTVAKPGVAGVANPGTNEDILDPESTSDFVDTQQFIIWPSDNFMDASYYVPDISEYYLRQLEGETFTYLMPGFGFDRNGWMISDGMMGSNFAGVPLIPDDVIEGNETLDMEIAFPVGMVNLGGEPIPLGVVYDKKEAKLNIIDDDFNPGTLRLAKSEFFINEDGLRAAVTVERVDGLNGLVSVEYKTTDGTAVEGLDYRNKKGTLIFGSGQKSKTFYVRISDDEFQEGDEYVNISIHTPRGGASIPAEGEAGLTARLVIVDNDLKSGKFDLDDLVHEIDEDGGTETIFVRRTGGSRGHVTVQYEVIAEAAGGALDGEDFVAATGTLTWADGDIGDKEIHVNILDDKEVEGQETLTVRIFGPQVAILGSLVQTTVTINDDDSFGEIELSRGDYFVNENGLEILVVVVRKGGFVGTHSIDFTTSDITAKSTGENPDYTTANGTLTFEPGETSKFIRIPLFDDKALENVEQFSLALSNPEGGVALGGVAQATFHLIDDESSNAPAGAKDVSFNIGAGANGPVNVLSLLPSGKLLVGGDFDVFNGIPVPKLIRLRSNGSLDRTFRTGSGPNAPLRDVLQLDSGFLLAIGDFTQYDGKNFNHIARLNVEGALDLTFEIGGGSNGNVHGAIEDDLGRIVLVGDFDSFNGLKHGGIVRVLSDGRLDDSFDAGSGANGAITGIVEEWDGSLIVVGSFDSFNGVNVPGVARLESDGKLDAEFLGMLPAISGQAAGVQLQDDGRILLVGEFDIAIGEGDLAKRYTNIVRLNRNGSVDESFQPDLAKRSPSEHLDGPVSAIAIQPDGRIILGGSFSSINGLTRSGIVRLDYNGELDHSINFGSGANDDVLALAVQDDFRLVVGGGFSEFDGDSAPRLVRLYGGLDYSPGRVRFEEAAYVINENGQSDDIILRREGGISNTGKVTVSSSSEEAAPGSDYGELSNVEINFESGQVFKRVHLVYHTDAAALAEAPRLTENGEPVLNVVNDTEAEEDQSIKLFFASVDGVQTGTQTETMVTLVSDDTAIRLAKGSDSVGESNVEGAITVGLTRNGPLDRAVSVDYYTIDGTAVSGGLQPDYVETFGTALFKVGQSTAKILIPILDDTHQEGVETLTLHLVNANPEGSAYIEGADSVELKIQDGDRDSLRSFISFRAETVLGHESVGMVTVKVIREGDLTRQASVGYATFDETAVQGVDYKAVSGAVTFAEGSAEEIVEIPILEDNESEGDETFALKLFNAKGAQLGALGAMEVKIPGNEAGTVVFASWNDETDWVNDAGSNKLLWDGDVMVDPDNALDIDWNKRGYHFFTSENETSLPWDADTANFWRGMSTAPWYWGTEDKISSDIFPKVQDQLHRIGGSKLGAVVTVTRVRGATGRLAIDYAITDGTAKAGEHYRPASGTIYMEDHQMSTQLLVPLVRGGKFVKKVVDTVTGAIEDRVVPSVHFNVRLFNIRMAEGEPSHLQPFLAQPNGSLSDEIVAQVHINRNYQPTLRPTINSSPDDVGVQFYRSKYRVKESQGSVVIRVDRGSISEPPNALGTLEGSVTVRWAVGPNFQNNHGDTPRPIRNAPVDPALPGPYGGDPGGQTHRNWLDFWDRQSPKIDLEPGSDYATPGQDFRAIHGQLTFGPGELIKTITIPILDDNEVEFNEDLFVFLYDPSPDVRDGGWGYVGNDRSEWAAGNVAGQYYAKITILSDDNIGAEQVAGSVDRSFNPDFQPTTSPPLNSAPGANDDVHAIALQSVAADPNDPAAVGGEKILVGGDFTAYNTVVRNRIARLNGDGSLDESFNVGTGADDFISSILVRQEGQIVLGGGFTSYNGTVRYSVAQLNANGSLDATFDPGQGANAPVRAMAFLLDESLLLAGEFTEYNNEPRTHLARVDSAGALDASFDFVDEGPNAPIYAIAVQRLGLQPEDEKILIGGDFTEVGNYRRGRLARLNVDGTVDNTFESIQGANGTINSIVVQGDGKILIAGSFSTINLVPRNGIARLNSDGSLDKNFDPGSGVDAPIYTVSIDGTAQGAGGIYIGGLFTKYNGTRRMGIARLLDEGTLDTTWLDTAYNQYAGLHKGAVSDPAQHVRAIGISSTGNVLIGGSFDRVGGGFTRDDMRNQSNIAQLVGGVTEGPGNIQLVQDQYSVDENTGELFILLERTNGDLGAAMANATIPSVKNGTGLASLGEDIDSILKTVTWPSLYWKGLTNSINGGGWMRSDAYSGMNNQSTVTAGGSEWQTEENNLVLKISEDLIVEGRETLDLQLFAPRGSLYLGGEPIALGTALGRSGSVVSIIDNDFAHGIFRLSAPEYRVDEHVHRATIKVERIKGDVGEVSVDYEVTEIDGGVGTSAIATGELADFRAVKGTLTFAPGEMSKVIEVPILDDTDSESDESMVVRLMNAKGGATLSGPFALGEANIIIIDNDYASGKLEVAEVVQSVSEADGEAVVTVRRVGGSVGEVSVSYEITAGDAVPDLDYVGVSGQLAWADGDTSDKSISVPLVNDVLVEAVEQFRVQLFGVAGAPGKMPVIGEGTGIVQISDDDRYGALSFTSADLYVNENSGQFVVTVVREFGTAEEVSVQYEAIPGSARAGADFQPVQGVLTFQPGQLHASFAITVNDDDIPEGPETINLILTGAKPEGEGEQRAILGTPNMATLSVLDNETLNEPAGSIDTSFNLAAESNDFVNSIAQQKDGRFLLGGDFTLINGLKRNRIVRLNDNGTVDTSFDVGVGLDNSAQAVTVQPDGRVVVAGLFTSVNGVNRNRIARLNSDGSVDDTFNPGGGANNPIRDLAVQSDGKVVIVGDFSSYNGVTRMGVARVNTDGTLDESFNPGDGADFSVFAVELQRDGKILIAGDFHNYDEVGSRGIARLNPDGSIDTSFSPGLGFDDSVRCVAIQEDGKIIVGGFFSHVGNVERGRIARLNTDGTLDADFVSGAGANGSVYSLSIQSDGKILAGGRFSLFNGLSRNGLVRLTESGSIDPTVNFGMGANGSVLAIEIRPNFKVLIAGGFTEFDGEKRSHFAQLHGGIMDGSGRMEFTSPVFEVGETGTNAVVRVVRKGGLADAVQVTFETRLSNKPNPAVPGLDYEHTTVNLEFPEGEVLQTVQVPIIDDDDVEPTEVVDLLLSNFTEGTQGLQSASSLLISSDDSVLSFASAAFGVSEDVESGMANIKIERLGAALGPAQVSFLTTTNGTALAGLDFEMVSNTVQFLDGEISKVVQVPIINDTLVENIENVTLMLTNAVGKVLLGEDESMLNIVDDDFAPGQFYFEAPSFKVRENAGFATVTVLRTNGYTGLIELEFTTSDLTAKNGEDYTAISGKLVFGDGESSRSFDIPIIDDEFTENAEALRVRIFNASGGGTVVPPSYSTVIIEDDESSGSSGGIKLDGANGTIYSVALDDTGKVLLGGEFSNVNGKDLPRLAKISQKGVVDEEFNLDAGPNNTIYNVIPSSDGGYWVGGLFSQMGDTVASHVAKLNADGSLDDSFNSSTAVDGTVFDILEVEEGLLVGGDFGLAMLNRDGSLNETFQAPDLDGAVYSISASPGRKIVIAGGFTTVNGDKGVRLARLHRNGAVDASFKIGEGPDGDVYAVTALNNGKILLGGLFVTIDGLSARRLALLDQDGKLDRSLKSGSGFDGPVRSIEVRADGLLLIGGAFTKYNYQPQNRLALIGLDGGIVESNFNELNLNGPVYSVSEQAGGLIAVGGSFTEEATIGGHNRFVLVEGASSTQPAQLAVGVMDSNLYMKVAGKPGLTYHIEISENMESWSPFTEVSIPAEGAMTLELGQTGGNRYYRAVYRE